MAKAIKVKVKLESTAGTGTFYLAEKNPRTHPEKLTLKKYDKKSKKHEEFVLLFQERIKRGAVGRLFSFALSACGRA